MNGQTRYEQLDEICKAVLPSETYKKAETLLDRVKAAGIIFYVNGDVISRESLLIRIMLSNADEIDINEPALTDDDLGLTLSSVVDDYTFA